MKHRAVGLMVAAILGGGLWGLAWGQSQPVRASGSPAAAKAGPAAAPVRPADLLLTETDYWRKNYMFFPPSLSAKSAQAKGLPRAGSSPTAGEGPTDAAARMKYFANHFASGLETPPPPATWATPDFDDAAWLLRRGREFVTGDYRLMEYMPPDATSVFLRGTDPFVTEVGLVAQRGRFLVKDKSKVGKLTLSLTYRGGFVACLNGKEVARASMPAGKAQPTTPAEDYPLEAWFVKAETAKLMPLHPFTHRQSEQWALRERTFGPVDIPLDSLRDGINVLSLEFHRSDYLAECFVKKATWDTPQNLGWATLGLSLLTLQAQMQAGAAEPMPARRAGGGAVQFWNADVAAPISDLSCPGPDQKLVPMQIVAARNGTFSGQVIVGSDRALEGLSAKVSELVSEKGKIPATAVAVRYGAANPTHGGGLGYLDTVLPADPVVGGSLGRRIDMLLEEPPTSANAKAPALTCAVWVTVRVGRDVPAGKYAGTLTVDLAGGPATKVPVELLVADWTLPDLKDAVRLLNIYQSPDTLAEYYKVPRWSDRHWQLIEKSLQLMGEAGNIGLFFPLLAESQMGNPESMVVWAKQPDGSYKYDFANFDRYLDTALKYHGRLRFLSLLVWGHEAGLKGYADRRGTLVTVQDASGVKSSMKLPACDTPECEAMWKPLLLAIRDRLKTKGLDKLILLGLPPDTTPEAASVAMFHRLLPDARWIRESHFNVDHFVYDGATKAAVPVAFTSIVWGGDVPDPKGKRLYGWKYNPDHLVMNFNRAGTHCLSLNGYPPPWSFRMWMESTLACGRNGNGRVGGDFWHIGAKFIGGGPVNSEASGGSSGTLFGIYLASSVGQVGLGNSTSDLFGPGPAGPVSTARFENAREGDELAETRIFIEQALTDKVLAKTLPPDLATRCQDLLDERTNVLRYWPIGAAALAPYNRQERDRRLFELAAEVAFSKEAKEAKSLSK